jgi:hypothetical protein
MTTLLHRRLNRNVILSVAVVIALAAGLDGCLPNRGGHLDPSPTPSVIPGNGITIYAAGDIAECKNLKPADTSAAKTAALIASGLAKDKDAVVLTLGDNAYPLGLPIEFTNCYDPTWGQFKARTYPAPGNHEYYIPAAIGYYGYFGAAAGPDRHGYYSVELGTWHVVSLNSNLKEDEQKAQLAWLKLDLEQHKAHCTLAYWHHPIVSSGGHGNNENMKEVWQALNAAGADVVLAGHDHDYERFAPLDRDGKRDGAHGIRQFVVGTGGAVLTPLRLPKSNSEVSDNSTHGVLKMVLKESGYEWEFLPVPGNDFSDRGAAFCH